MHSDNSSSGSAVNEAVAIKLRAQFEMAMRLIKGNGETKDTVQGMALLEDLAMQGDGDAQCELGYRCFIGDLIERDVERGIKLWRDAADKEHAGALCRLGSIYYNGQVVEQDRERGVALWTQAASKGDVNAATYLGSQYLVGNIIPKDYPKAIQYLTQAGERNSPSALHNLAVAYSNGWGVEANTDMALDFFKRAADAGYTNAMDVLGQRYRDGTGGVSQDYPRALAYFKKAAEAGHDRAQCSLADMYENGQGVPQDFQLAHHWYEKSASKDNQWAEYSLGLLYKLGRGVPADSRTAGRWFENAARSGHIKSMGELMAATGAQRVRGATMLAKVKDDKELLAFVPEICDCATSNDVQLRTAAEALVRRVRDAALEPLKEIARSGKPDRRVNSLKLLWTLAREQGDADLTDFAVTTASADAAPTVRMLVELWDGSAAANDLVEYNYEVPQIAWATELTSELVAAVETLWQDLNRPIDEAYKRISEHHDASVAKRLSRERYSDDQRTVLLEYITAPQALPVGQRYATHWHYVSDALTAFAAHPAVNPVVLIKTVYLLGAEVSRDAFRAQVLAIEAMHAQTGRPSLLEFSEIAKAFGHDARTFVDAYCRGWSSLGANWSSEAVWPFFAHHRDLLVEALGPAGRFGYYFDRQRVYTAVASLPWPPKQVVDAIFDLALGTAKTERPMAQAALANFPDKETRIIDALSDGRAEVRAVAAQWLASLRHEAAVPALEAATGKEKNDLTKGAMLDALQAFGKPIEAYLDRKALLKDAAKTVAKGAPKDLDWFPWNAIPTVRWADSLDCVDPQILQWMVMQAVKQKSPEPNAVLRKYCGMFEPRDREAFGQFVLESWLTEDTRTIPLEAAMDGAQQRANVLFSAANKPAPQPTGNRYDEYYRQAHEDMVARWGGLSVEQITAMVLPGYQRQLVGSAIGSKGLLAIAAACCAERAAAPVGRYLKEYYGTRAAHGKALIAMLAWIEHPSAIQLMLSVGNRFRTKSIQEEATKQAEALAERKGWTMAELADRTIPSGGFDESGALELSYGERTFRAKLLPDFKIELYNPDGKKIAALPEPRGDDDADMAKLSKQALSSAKKEIKTVVALQTDRLYEALCTERHWSFADWRTYLNQHAVVRRLIQRLVWVEVKDGHAVRSFRPLDDGTLSDFDDNEVELDADAEVRVAHDSVLAPEDVQRWQAHFADYEISPLFEQLGKGTYVLPEAKSKDNAVSDFEGHMLEAFALRGRALKLGYLRGATEDGGWFYTYEKRFPTLGITALIEFSGNGLPEENRTVALVKLAFAREGESRWQAGSVPLQEVPKILLSECYNDMRLIAADGSGFDEKWKEKVGL
ncbi:MAG: SEL1-like repeat protein [Burkholderiales bacterium]|nr:SEL1-like repeat protein [Burkholderiales bacterium]